MLRSLLSILCNCYGTSVIYDLLNFEAEVLVVSACVGFLLDRNAADDIGLMYAWISNRARRTPLWHNKKIDFDKKQKGKSHEKVDDECEIK